MDEATGRLVARSPLLKGLKRDLVARMLAAAGVREVPRRGAVWASGEVSGGLGFVRSGVLRETLGVGAHEVLLRLAVRGEWVGDRLLLGGGRHHTELAAHEDAVLVWFPAEVFDPLDAALARRLGADVADRCRRLEERLAHVAYRTVEGRLATTLLELADTLGVRDSRGTIVNLRLTRKDLASLAGTTRESTSTVVGQWQRAGLVETDERRLVVLDPARLGALAAGG